ncbi:hypothetical protein YC2023_033622 [Brassica napus]
MKIIKSSQTPFQNVTKDVWKMLFIVAIKGLDDMIAYVSIPFSAWPKDETCSYEA